MSMRACGTWANAVDTEFSLSVAGTRRTLGQRQTRRPGFLLLLLEVQDLRGRVGGRRPQNRDLLLSQRSHLCQELALKTFHGPLRPAFSRPDRPQELHLSALIGH